VDNAGWTDAVYEIVVVGGGSGGAAAAGTLAAAGRDVLLLEAGPDYGPFGDPRWAPELVDARMLATTHDWDYADDRWRWERARVIGGCSSHNGAIAAVGHRVDYDAWGLRGWSASDVAPVFAEVVARMRVRAYARSEAVPFHEQCLQAAEAIGWTIASDLCDLDAGDSFGLETVNVDGGVRWNAAFAYLDPVRHLDGLRIVDHVLVDRFVERPDHVEVHVRRLGESSVVRAATLVLAGGAYGTPLILQRSGIGREADLRDAGVEVVRHLPGVGGNLHDHPMMHVDRAVGPELQRFLDDAAATGFLPEEQTLGKWTSPVSIDGRYDTHVFPVIASNQTSVLHGRATIEVACMNPASRGRVTITSADPDAPPSIDHGYLTDHEGHDLAVVRAGLARAEELFAQPSVAALVGAPITDASTDEAILAQVAHYYHPVGTCAMGTGPDSVCDHRGVLHGSSRVRVADASLFPAIMRANTNLPAVAAGVIVARDLLRA
jgi:choline dehydrogenase